MRIDKKLAAAVAFIVFGSGLTAAHADDKLLAFNLAEQRLGTALNDLAVQADLEILYSPELVEDKRSVPVQGDYAIADALDTLLADSGLTYEYTREDTVLIRASSESGVQTSGKFQPASNQVLMTQSQTSAEQNQTTGRGRTTTDDAEDVLEEIVVVGSHIRGEVPVGSKVITIDRQEIDQAGFATTQEIMHSLPQNFRGGINEDAFTTQNLTDNPTGGTSINLRGLGVGTTLTLVNGRRQPSAGRNSNFVDVSNISASAIERVEVLADGASALYGSDAIGGVVNIVLRKDYDGAETRLRAGRITEGGANEYQFSQILGENWNSGNVLLAYEYYNRDGLGWGEKPFTASSDLRPYGGDDFRINDSVPGNITRVTLADGSRVNVQYAIPSGQDGTNLTSGDLLDGEINLFNSNPGRDLLTEQERHGVLLTVSQELSENIELFAEGRFTDRDFKRRGGQGSRTLDVPSSNPFFVDPLGGGGTAVRIRYNQDPDFTGIRQGGARVYQGVLGLITDFGNDWTAQIYGSYGEESDTTSADTVSSSALSAALADPDPVTAFNPFGDGSFQQNRDTIDTILTPRESRDTTDLWSVNAVFDGPVFQTPGGDVKLAVGANYDDSSFEKITSNNGVATVGQYERKAAALFAEIRVPLFDEGNSRKGLQRLLLTASARYEDYDDVGDTTNPKLGVLWAPMEGLEFRGTYGTSFRAPDLQELDDSANSNFHFTLADDSSPTGSTLVLLQFGNNGDLENETATVWTVGFDLAPPAFPNFLIDATYYNIDFKDRISSGISSLGFILNQEERFASAITRNPSQELLDSICNSGITFRDRGVGPCTMPVGAVVDGRLINTAVSETDGVDFNVHYGFDTENAGHFELHFGGTYVFSFKEAFGPTASPVELVDTIGQPIGLRMRNSVAWESKGSGLSAVAYLNYADNYRDNVSVPERDIDSWTTVDLTIAYDTDDRRGLKDTVFSLSVQNLFDEDPPFANNSTGGNGYDPNNASPLGRFMSFNITKRW